MAHPRLIAGQGFGSFNTINETGTGSDGRLGGYVDNGGAAGGVSVSLILLVQIYRGNPSQQFHYSLQFRIRVVKMRREPDVMLFFSICAQGGYNICLGQFLVQCRQVRARFVE